MKKLCLLAFLLVSFSALAQERTFQKAAELFDRKDYQEAIEAYAACIKNNYKVDRAYYYRSRAYYFLGNSKKAIKDLEVLISLFPDDYDAWNMMGTIYHEKGHFQKAMDNYLKSVQINPEYDTAWYNLAFLAHNDFQDPDTTLFYIRNAIAINPEDPDYFYEEALILEEKEYHTKALEAVKKAIVLDSLDPYTWFELGWLFDLEEKGDSALYGFEKALSLTDTVQEFRTNRIRMLITLEKYGEAQEALDQEIRKEMKDTYVQYLQARLYNETGEYEKALAAYDAVLKKDEKDAQILLERGDIHQQLGKYEAALADLERVCDLVPEDDYNWQFLGNLYYELNRYKEAKNCFDMAISLDPGEAVYYYNRGLIAYEMDNPDAACRDWSQASFLGDRDAKEMLREICLDINDF